MKNLILSILVVAVFNLTLIGQEKAYHEKELNIQISSTEIKGTLLTPSTIKNIPLVIFIAGSGPTDRNGNSGFIKNNSLKFLAESLVKKNIATYRFDKSVLHESKKEGFKEDSLRFEDEVTEVIEIVNHFKKNKIYSKIYLLGHSQGSLVGILAATKNVDGLISIAGAGRPIDEVIAEQIGKQAPFLKDETVTILSELKKGKMVEEYNPMLISLFRKSVQPFLISWIKYHPQYEIHRLTIPVLIINGTKDIQVPKSDALLLKEANKDAELVIIENMNHIFKNISGDMIENQQSYTNPNLPVMDELTLAIEIFIHKQK